MSIHCILIWGVEGETNSHNIYESEPGEADRTSQLIINNEQKREARLFPSDPRKVTGTLYRPSQTFTGIAVLGKESPLLID
jgi:hypothetical protein